MYRLSPSPNIIYHYCYNNNKIHPLPLPPKYVIATGIKIMKMNLYDIRHDYYSNPSIEPTSVSNVLQDSLQSSLVLYPRQSYHIQIKEPPLYPIVSNHVSYIFNIEYQVPSTATKIYIFFLIILRQSSIRSRVDLMHANRQTKK